MKKYSLLYIIFLLLFSSRIYAEELQVPTKQPSIQDLIQKVKSAKVKDRRILMNQLKIQLRKMNKESRHNAMMELKKSFSKEHSGKKLYKEQHKRLHQQRGEHQPMYRHLRNMQQERQQEHIREGSGHK